MIDFFGRPQGLCRECQAKLKVIQKEFEFKEMKGIALYEYNEDFAGMLLQYKELNDEALYPVFLEKEKRKLRKKYQGYTIVTVPSSKGKMEKRGFDAVQKIFSVLKLPMVTLFEKDESVDQKQLSMSQRHQVYKTIHLKKDVQLPEGPVLLVDDVVTTGSSLLTCYRLLSEKGLKVNVFSLSIVRDNGT